MNQLLNSIVLKIGTYLIPICSVMMVLSTQIISVLYQHGKFTAASTAATSSVLILYLVGAMLEVFEISTTRMILRNLFSRTHDKASHN